MATSTTGAIPFNTHPALEIGGVVDVFVVCAVVLALFAILAWIAKRQGWLKRLGVAPTTDTRRRIEIRSTQRLSPQTTVFVVAHDNREFLLVESARQVTIQPLAPVTGEART